MNKETENEAQRPDSTTDQELSKPPEVVKKKSFWSSDKFLSLFAFLVSMGTFFTFAYQTYLIQKQQYASMMPYLKLDLNKFGGEDGVPGIELVLTNNGVGPAFIQDIAIDYQDSVYREGILEFLYDVVPFDSAVSILTIYPIYPGDVVPVGKEWMILSVEGSNTVAAISSLREVDSLGRKAEIKITYSSIYDEAWQLVNENPPKKIE